jgi:glycosyltransferase involved in cell wall biosynthesis
VSAQRRLASVYGPFDVLHANIYDVAAATAVAGRISRTPVVATEHSTIWPSHGLSRRGVWRARIGFRLAARTMPVSQSLQRSIESYGVRTAFEVIPNAVDTTIFHPHARTRLRIAFVGAIDANKNPRSLIRTLPHLLQRHPGLIVTIVGDGPDRRDLEDEARPLGVEDAIEFTGALPKADVAGIVSTSRVLALPSYRENLPCVLLESLCSGVPVVATRVGGVEEIVGAHDGVLIPPGDDEALYEALDGVLSDPGRFDRRAIAERAVARFSRTAVGLRLDGVYRSVR